MADRYVVSAPDGTVVIDQTLPTGYSVACEDTTPPPPPIAYWSDPASWPGGVVPADDDDVTVPTGSHIILDVNARVSNLTILPGASLEHHGLLSTRLTYTNRVNVRGTYRMRPADATAVAELASEDIDETVYIGGDSGMATDPGVHVMDDGVLDWVGTHKQSWSRLVGAGAIGDQVAVDSALGWLPSDQVAVTPTVATTETNFWKRYTETTADGMLADTHPEAYGRRAEVLNLSRNVRCITESGGRSHVMFHPSVTTPQALADVEFRGLGPGEPLGRYPVHFHRNADNSRGSTISGCVVVDSRNRAFVTHGSHEIAVTDCVAHDVVRSAYWWDRGPDVDDSNDIVWDTCVASKVRHSDTSPKEKFTVTGFYLVDGDGNSCTNCVSVGIEGDGGGSSNSSGYQWPEAVSNTGVGVWTFSNNVAHNCRRNGSYIWQNDSGLHDVDNFVVYHCGASGIDLGAYTNAYVITDAEIYGCATGVVWHAQSRPAPLRPAKIVDLHVEDCNVAIKTATHNVDGQGVEVQGLTTVNVPDAFIGGAQHITNSNTRHPDEVDVYAWEGPVVTYSPGAHPDSVWRFHRNDGTVETVTP